jgi:uncharacterized protein with von Willebrand factor type A (vWA) domain
VTTEELRSMLGLSDSVTEGEAESVAAESVAVAEEVPASEYAMKLDMWGKAKGKELLEAEMLKPLDKKTAEAVADFYGAAFEPEPEPEERCVSQSRHEFLKSMLETAEYRELHASTAMEDLPSEIACASFAKQYYELVEEHGENPSELDRMRAAGRAIREAGKEVRDFKEACDACGLGGDGANPSAYDTKKAIEVYKKVRGSQFLRDLFNKAGKYKRFAAQMQRVKVNHGMDDAVGVTMGGSIADLLPSELANLVLPELEWDMLRKIMENEAMIRQYQGIERVGKGPLFIVVDESGSMKQDGKIEDAKAVALTLAYLARQQRRWACLIGFSGGEQGNALLLKPGRWGEADIIPWLEHFYSGGTDMDVPLVEIQKIYKEVGAPVGKTDMVCITDAIVRIPPKMEASFLKWKKEVNLTMFTLVIGCGQPGDMTKVSDQVHMIRSLSTDEQGVQEVFKI